MNWLVLLAAQTCSLTGTVVDATTSEAVFAADVEVKSSTTARLTKTSSIGFFAVQVPCGAVSVTVERADYQPRRLTTKSPSQLELTLEPKVVTRIDDVVVVAPSLRPEDTRAATTISGADLERRRGDSLADAVERVPGVTVLRSGTVAKPIIRGQSGPRVLVLFDGVRHAGQAWGLDHGPEIDPWTAGSLTVVRGAAGVRYGAEAIGGVVLVEPPPMLEQPGLSAKLGSVFALNGRKLAAAARFDGRLASLPEFAWRAEGSINRSAALSSPDYPLDNTGAFEYNLGGALSYDADDWGLKLSLNYLSQVNGLCNCLTNDTFDDFMGQVIRDRPQGSEFYNVAYQIERPRQDVSHTRAILRGERRFGDAVLGATYAAQLNLREEREVVRRADRAPSYDFTLWTHTLDLNYAHAPIEWGERLFEGTVGLSGVFQDNRYAGLPLIPQYRAGGVGAFWVERLRSESFELEAGLRYEINHRNAVLEPNDHSKLLAVGQLAEGDCSEGDDEFSCPSTFHSVSVSLGGLRRLTDKASIKVDLSSAARTPTIDEQYINGTAPSFPILSVGDPGLSPETSYTLSTSLAVQDEVLTADVSVFGSFVDGYINFSPDLNPDGTPIFMPLIRGNLPQFSFKQVSAAFVGADAQVGLRKAWFEAIASGSLVWGRDLTLSSPLAFVPPPRARLELAGHLDEWGVVKNGRASVFGTYVWRQGNTDLRVDLAPAPAGYALLGASVSADLDLGGRVYQASLEGNNLLNQRYRDYTSLLRYYADEPGVQVILRLGTQLELY